VTCSGNPEACGVALQQGIDNAPWEGTIYVCPGTYRGGFIVARSLTIIGAGQGSDPTSNTVLDGNKTQRVIRSSAISPVTLERLHITGGEGGANGGGGIHHSSTLLTMRDCTIAGNRAELAAGMFLASSGTLEMTRCTVRSNVAAHASGNTTGGGFRLEGPATFTDCLITRNEVEGVGGGICAMDASQLTLAGETMVQDNTASQGGGLFIFSSPTSIGPDCRIKDNTATAGAGAGGGILNASSTVTLEGSGDPSPIVTHNCHENCAGDDIALCEPGGHCPE
jgi:hypothetical protein